MRQSIRVGALATTTTGVLAGTSLLVHHWFATGPRSFRAEFDRLAAQELAAPPPGGVVAERDLDGLPAPLARFLYATGAIGSPRITNFTVRLRGRIRGGPHERWMPFTGDQVTRYGPTPSRLFRITASMRGVPTDVFHSFVGADATMRVKLLSMFPIVDVRGPEMNRSETVTIFNDMCVFAPAALLDARVVWQAIDGRTVRGTFTRLDETVSATLHFDEHDLLVDFVSDDRHRASRDASSYTRQRWSTPLGGYRRIRGRTVATSGAGRWHGDPPEGEFTYLEITVDDVEYNVHTR